jgi:DNA uptake protein ComE-like DNA-binding protein
MSGKWIAVLVVVGLAAVTYRFYHRAPTEGSLLVNVNAATKQQLETLPGIGPALAARIIEERPYSMMEDIDGANGIGPAKLKQLRSYVKVDGETGKRN